MKADEMGGACRTRGRWDMRTNHWSENL